MNYGQSGGSSFNAFICTFPTTSSLQPSCKFDEHIFISSYKIEVHLWRSIRSLWMERAHKTLIESGQLYHQLLCLSGCSRNPARLVLCSFPPSIRSNTLKPKELRSRGGKKQSSRAHCGSLNRTGTNSCLCYWNVKMDQETNTKALMRFLFDKDCSSTPVAPGSP